MNFGDDDDDDDDVDDDDDDDNDLNGVDDQAQYQGRIDCIKWTSMHGMHAHTRAVAHTILNAR